jgi:hypothetical protein
MTASSRKSGRFICVPGRDLVLSVDFMGRRNSVKRGGLNPVMKASLPVLPVFLFVATLVGTAGAQQRGRDNAPAEGARIPQVSAQTPDGKDTVELDKPKRHTVLVFGSYT